MSLANHEKARIALRYWTLGKGMLDVTRALAHAESFHTSVRKDGITPEFSHQIWICNTLRILPLNDDDMRLALLAGLYHDTPEDKDMPFIELATKYDARVARIVELLTKVHRGVKVPADTYFAQMVTDPIAAIVKGVDRLHNLSSMHGVFTRAKQESYITETLERHLPMLKKARNLYPEYDAAIENIKQSLLSRITLIQAIHTAEDAARQS